MYRLTTTVTQNTRKTSSNCMVKEVQRRVVYRIIIDYMWKYNKISQLGILTQW